MSVTIEIIQTFVAPVVMVSANGLLCLGFYNRLAAVVNRGRMINKERIDLLTHLASLNAAEKQRAHAMYMQRRTEMLDRVGTQLLHRAQWVRRVLYCLLLAVLCMLACSLTLGLVTVTGYFAMIALGFFVTGTLLMMAGGTMAILELHLSLEPLMFETECIDLAPLEEFAVLEEVASILEEVGC
jgi:hypothetical protein